MALKIKAEPTFRAKVMVPVAGGEDVEVEFEFKHRSRSDLVEFMKTAMSRKSADVVEDMLAGWQFADQFTRKNIELLIDDHIGVDGRLLDKYCESLVGRRLGN